MRFKTMQRKQKSVSAFGILRKLGVTMHFSEIIKLQFGKKKHSYLACISLLFRIIILLLNYL